MKQDSANFMDWSPEYVIRSENYSEMFADCKLDSIVESNYYQVAASQYLPDKKAYLLKKKVQNEE